MAYDLEEQESIDQMKAWWDQWGTPITAAVCVCCLGFAGWNGWQWYQRNQAAQASGAYVQLQNAIYQNDTKNVKSIADGLIEDYGTTIYAPLGALASAAAEVQEGNLDLARDRLVWVIEKSGHPEYDTIARVRLAGVELSAKKPEAALKALEPAKPVPDQTPEGKAVEEPSQAIQPVPGLEAGGPAGHPRAVSYTHSNLAAKKEG